MDLVTLLFMMPRPEVSLLIGICLGLVMPAQGHSIDETLRKLQTDVQGLKNRVTTLEGFINPSGTNHVSFLAGLSSQITPKQNDILKFDSVIQNFGNGYSPTTGKFTAPVSGTYLFHVSAVAKAQIQVDLVMDGDRMATAWGYSGTGDVQGSNMAVVHMRQGQRMWARFMRGNQRVISGGYTQFTGTLLHKD